MPVPMRNVIGRNSPTRIYEFGDKIHQKLVKDNEDKQAGRERSGKISGGKLGKPTLWAVLDLIGVPDEFDPYVLGKFQRGNDVEARANNMLTNLPINFVTDVLDGVIDNPGWTPSKGILNGEFYLQKPGSYRGGVGFIDFAQRVGSGNDQGVSDEIYHEIKSSTKMAYDKVSASGRYKGVVDIEKGTGVPYIHHALQLAYYCLGDNVSRSFLHYFNADDYRLCTFAINPLDYKEEIDKEIDDIEMAFTLKELPAFEGFLPYHKVKAYWSYKEWNELTPAQALFKLQHDFPEQYKKFMEMKLGE
jgi:hypothetical protein